MASFTLESTIKEFNLLIVIARESNDKNDLMFRRICKEIFRKSYSNLKFQNNGDNAPTLTKIVIIKLLLKCFL